MLLPLTADDRKEVTRLLGADSSPAAEAGAGPRHALVLSYNPMRPLPAGSKEIRRYLAGRARRPGSLQILLVLRAVAG